MSMRQAINRISIRDNKCRITASTNRTSNNKEETLRTEVTMATTTTKMVTTAITILVFLQTMEVLVAMAITIP